MDKNTESIRKLLLAVQKDAPEAFTTLTEQYRPLLLSMAESFLGSMPPDTLALEDLVQEGFYNKEEIEQHIFPKLLSDKDMKHIFYFLWGKAIKRELALKHQLNVNPAISLGEDLSCIVPCFLEAG